MKRTGFPRYNYLISQAYSTIKLIVFLLKAHGYKVENDESRVLNTPTVTSVR